MIVDFLGFLQVFMTSVFPIWELKAKKRIILHIGF